MRRIANGEDANVALNLKRQKKRPPETDRLKEIAVKMERKIQSGMSKETAAEEVGRDCGRDETSNIKKAHTKFKKYAKAFVAMEKCEAEWKSEAGGR